jgi:hypothetical protein
VEHPITEKQEEISKGRDGIWSQEGNAFTASPTGWELQQMRQNMDISIVSLN